jgi:hypothetical protein
MHLSNAFDLDGLASQSVATPPSMLSCSDWYRGACAIPADAAQVSWVGSVRAERALARRWRCSWDEAACVAAARGRRSWKTCGALGWGAGSSSRLLLGLDLMSRRARPPPHAQELLSKASSAPHAHVIRAPPFAVRPRTAQSKQRHAARSRHAAPPIEPRRLLFTPKTLQPARDGRRAHLLRGAGARAARRACWLPAQWTPLGQLAHPLPPPRPPPQIHVPADLGDILKAFTKEVIRKQPADLLQFSAQ